MSRPEKIRTRLAGGLLAAASVAVLAAPATAQAAAPAAHRSTVSAAPASEAGITASWRTLATYRTSLGCKGEKASLELSTPWVLRCQSAGAFTHHLQRYH
ncbi:hypothetical protein [Streptomyces sp. AD55]|uniref:hypothetical protein n=1 Tax=Streptomyces sp. AD55 TaxID=3242895 RepID=UPI00352848C5